MWLNAMMLAGLLGVALPIAIHLLNRRPPEPRRWAAMRFLKQAIEKHRRRIRRDDLILLLLRCLAVALLALAMARPVLDRVASLAGGGQVTLVIDDTLSTRHSDGATTRFDRIRDAARQFVQSMPAATRWTIVPLSDPERGSSPTTSSSAMEQIDSLQPSWRSGDLSAVLSLTSRQAGTRIVFVGDDQASTFRDADRLPETIDALIVRSTDYANTAVAEIAPADGWVTTSRPTRFRVRIAHSGQPAREKLRLTVEVVDPAGRVVASTQRTLDQIEDRAESWVEVALRIPDAGPWVVRASITPDALPDDDVARYAMEVLPEVSVLMVGPAEDLSFVAEAWRASGGAVSQRTVEPPRLESEPLGSQTLIVLAAGGALSDASASRLEQYVRLGGWLVVFADGPVDRLASLLPGRWIERVERETPAGLVADPALPLGSIWSDAGMLAGLGVRSHARVEPSTGARVAIRLTDGTPLLLDHGVGAGRVALVATTADAAGSDLPLRPGVFVPLLYRMLGLASRQADPSPTLHAGESIKSNSPAPVPIERADAPIADAEGRWMFNQPGSWLAGGRAVAVNTPSVESDLTPLDDAQRERLASRVRFVDAGAGREDLPLRDDPSLSLILIVLAGGVLLGEQLVASRVSRSR